MRTLVVGTAGHIDHGKSALVRALTGTDPDRLPEERARGITIDLGFAHTQIGDTRVAFVDVPGHERFVRNMLAGAGGTDAVVLVVAANESVMPQTREHFAICRLLGVERGLVALTKADLADDDLLALATADVRALVAGSFLQGAPIVPVSVETGRGLDDVRAALAALAGGSARQHRPGIVRLPIDRVFSVKGFGTVVTGTLVSGALASGDAASLLPIDRTVRIRGLQVHGAAQASAEAPARVAVNLAGVDVAELRRGITLATPGAFAVTRRADVRLSLLADARSVRHGARVRVHHGTMEIVARVSLSAVRTPGEPWLPARPGEAGLEVPPGGEAFARLRFDRPAVLTRGDRLVLRAPSPVTTIGGARVLDAQPPEAGVRRRTALDRFVRLAEGDSADVATLVVGEAGQWGLERGAFVGRLGLAPGEAEEAAARVLSEGGVIVGDRVFGTAAVGVLRQRITDALKAYHRDRPDEPGMPRETLRERSDGSGALAAFVIDQLEAAGTIRGTDRIALAQHQPVVSAQAAKLRDDVEARFRGAGLAPPDRAGLASETSTAAADVESAIQALVREGRLVRVGDFVFHADALGTLKAALAGLRAGQPPAARVTLDVASFKERFKLTRRHAIPLLEWLDRERVTRRLGDVRIVL